MARGPGSDMPVETPRLHRLAAQLVPRDTATPREGATAAETTEMSPTELPLSDGQVRQFAADVRYAHAWRLPVLATQSIVQHSGLKTSDSV